MRNILSGLQIIARYDPTSDFSAQHDQIWCGGSDMPLTPDERAQMEALGWFEDQDSWSHFC